MVLRKCSNVLPTIQDAEHSEYVERQLLTNLPVTHHVVSSSAYELLNDPLPAPNFGMSLQSASNGMHTLSDAPQVTSDTDELKSKI